MYDFLTLIVVMVPQMYIYLQTDQVVYITCVHFCMSCIRNKISCRNRETISQKSKKTMKSQQVSWEMKSCSINPQSCQQRPRCEAWPVRCPTPRTALQGQFTASQVQQGPEVGSWAGIQREHWQWSLIMWKRME